VQLCFVTEIEFNEATQMRGAIEVDVLAGNAYTTCFHVRHYALHVDVDAFGNHNIQVNVMAGYCIPGDGSAKERAFEGNVDYRTFPLTVVGT
jgi:hypothetical protein